MSSSAKYEVRIDQALAVAVGDGAQVEIHAPEAKPSLPSRDGLLTAIRQASATLRTCARDIAGIHIDRAEVGDIIGWAIGAEPQEQLGILQDRPGGGKTVVMRDALQGLEDQEVPVLAIKADWLSGIKTADDLADRLGLPAPVEDCARALASEGLFVVLFDQLDALSLALSRDQATLDVMLSTLNRLRDIENVRIIASCRVFELNNDPHLSTIKVDRTFTLQPLDEAQVSQILDVIGVDLACLLPEHRELIAIPLHLKIYAQVVGDSAPQGSPESFRTLQDLYEALWQKRIMATVPGSPSPSARRDVIYRLVDEMQANRQLTVPVAVLDEHSEAAGYLKRERFIRREGGNWLFAHQTLFDYCYARRFVAQRKSLSVEILSGSQGLFERSQMIQVLAHLRGADEAGYLRELTSLLSCHDLRVHLRLLLIGWFGSLPDPTAEELRIARRLIHDPDNRTRFLRAASANEGWFDLLEDEVVPSLLRSDEGGDIELVIGYLGTLIQRRTGNVLDHLHPYLAKSKVWDARIALCLSHLDEWESEEALEVLCDLFRRGYTGGQGEPLCLYQLAQSNPAAGCHALRAYLDRRLDDLLVQDTAEIDTAEADAAAFYRTGVPYRFKWSRELLGQYAIGEIMAAAAQECPEALIRQLLPWFVRALGSLTRSTNQEDEYPSDPLFSFGWYSEHRSEGAEFARRMAEALSCAAQTRPGDFRAVARESAAVESLAAHRVLAQAYLSDPETYAGDIFEYLIADRRRLSIGEHVGGSSHDDSCLLYAAAFRHVDDRRRSTLEQMILQLQPEWERRSLRHRGITQLRFLKTVPRNLLSREARDLLGELERKFPDFELRPAQGTAGGWVGPPIDSAAQKKMSDEAWLGAMRKYNDSGHEHRELLKGGVRELASGFSGRVKEEPERFYRLAQRFDQSISLHYVAAAISGLGESEGPADWTSNLVRRFAPRAEGEFRRVVCRALEKQAEHGVPDDLLDVVTEWALHDLDPERELWRVPASGGKPYYGGDPHFHGINTNRGAAVETLCRCALARTPAQDERAFTLLEQAANDPSTAVRTCVIERLGSLLRYDANRTLAIFEEALGGHPRLLQSPLTHRFLYWTYYGHFTRIRPFVEALLRDNDDATRQAGARLACLAAFHYPEAEALARQVVGPPLHGAEEGFGRSMLVAVQQLRFHIWRILAVPRREHVQSDRAMRQGAAEVYARNLEQAEIEDVCRERLLQLMNDPDERVRSHVGKCFIRLRAEHLVRSKPFIERFLGSPALMDGARHLVEYLAPLAADAPDLALEVTERILDAIEIEVTDVRKVPSILERDVVRLPLTVYTHTPDPKKRSRAMSLFERLLLLGSRAAHQALEDWDRQ